MFSSRVRDGKAFSAEQRIREVKRLLFKSKKDTQGNFHQLARFDPKKLIRKATANMNNSQSQKYSYSPEAIEENVGRSDKFRDKLLKLQKHTKRYPRADAKKDKLLSRLLRKPRKVGERMLALAERLKKEDAPKHLYKSTTENVSFFNREQIFVVRNTVKTWKD